MQLHKLKEHTYYFDNACNIGVFEYRYKKVALIDSGVDKYTAKKILRLLNDEGLTPTHVISTHYHADHMGGNAFLGTAFDLTFLAPAKELAFFEYPFLEPLSLVGGNPPSFYLGKFLMADACKATALSSDLLPKGLFIVNLSGHTQGSVGIVTSDKVAFLGDALFSQEVLTKYPVSYMFDPTKQYETLCNLKELEADIYVPSHSVPLSSIKELIEINKDNLDRFISCVLSLTLKNPTFEDILNGVFLHFNMQMDKTQYLLVSSSIRGAITHLINEKKVDMQVIDNKMCYVNLT